MKVCDLVRDKSVVIFDWDGTLVDSKKECYLALKTLFKDKGKNLTFEEFLNYDIDPNRNIFVENEEIEANKFNELFYSICKDSIRLKHAAEKLINRLREDKKHIAIATNGPTDAIRSLIKHIKCDKFFDFVIGVEDNVKAKPKPDMLFKVMHHFKVSVDRCVFIGDAPRDIEAAKSASMCSIGLIDGVFPYNVIASAKPDFLSTIERIIE